MKLKSGGGNRHAYVCDVSCVHEFALAFHFLAHTDSSHLARAYSLQRPSGNGYLQRAILRQERLRPLASILHLLTLP